MERASALGASFAGGPLRLVHGLAPPSRGDIARSVRRSIGLGDEPRPVTSDPGQRVPAPWWHGRHLHADLPSMLIGGMSALFVQSLHPLAMAGVAEHSNYREDPAGRLRRTAAFVGATTFGTEDEAAEAIERVQRVHRRVHGTAPDGRPYSAEDPELVTFIHVAEVSSFLGASRRYGTTPVTPREADRYYEEMAPVALALGATWAPRSSLEVESYLTEIRPELHAGPQARPARDWLLRGVGRRRPAERAASGLILAASIGVLPPWARRELGLSLARPLDLLSDAAVITPLARALAGTLRFMVTPPS